MSDAADLTDEEIDGLAVAWSLMHAIDPEADRPSDLTGDDGKLFHVAFAQHFGLGWVR